MQIGNVTSSEVANVGSAKKKARTNKKYNRLLKLKATLKQAKAKRRDETTESELNIPTVASPILTLRSLSSPRKKKNPLANLYSDLSPKYIGFATSSDIATEAEEADVKGRRRSRRRTRHSGGSEKTISSSKSKALLGHVRRAHSASITDAAKLTPHKRKIHQRKSFISPIDKLLVRNGSKSIIGFVGDLSQKSLPFEYIQRASPSNFTPMANRSSPKKEANEPNEVYVEAAESVSASDVAPISKNNSSEYISSPSKEKLYTDESADMPMLNSFIEIDDDDTNKDYDVAIPSELIVKVDVEGSDNLAGYSVKSPSASSTDSAKGSSIVTDSPWNSFTNGDLFWGQIFNYSYWPCMVAPDPDDKKVTTVESGRHGEQHLMVHVRFFADNGRRNWVKRENLMPYTGWESYQERIQEAEDKHGKKSSFYKLLVPKPTRKQIWLEAIKEANIVADTSYPERLDKFMEICKNARATQKLQRKRRASLALTTVGSDIELLNGSISSVFFGNSSISSKRSRSPSPQSPAFSPIKTPLMKRRKANDELMANTNKELTLSSFHQASASLAESVDLLKNNDFKKFYLAMKDFVLAESDAQLEENLIVAVNNIWALKRISHVRMEQRVLKATNGNTLGSVLVDSTRGDGSIRRLSNRLKSIATRPSLPQQSPTIAIHSTAENAHEIAVTDERKKLVSVNRPIEEVIDDIFNLDKKYLFKGLTRDPVCKYCLRPGGDMRKCSKLCQNWFHHNCRKNPNNATKDKSARRSKDVARFSSDNYNANHQEGAAILSSDAEHQQTKTIKPNVAATKTTKTVNNNSTGVHITGESEDFVVVACPDCAAGEPLPCSVCNKNATSEPIMMCNVTHCVRAFHASCCRYWPQTKIVRSKNKVESFRCPSHVCHTCVSDDPKSKYQHISSSKLTKCVKCPATFHVDSTCIPAGSEILTAAHIVCPRHINSKSDLKINGSWCFLCAKGGKLVCCETCPVAVHPDCLISPIDPDEPYICDECESGKMPLYGEIVWAKFNSFRWWPAIILPPTEVPLNISRKPHNSWEFVVRFFGTHDHGWISRRRVYLFAQGDGLQTQRPKNGLEARYIRGVEEATKFYEIVQIKMKQYASDNKMKLHPQPFARIKMNRLVPPVKLQVRMDKMTICECDPNAESPCGLDTNCLNRMLLNECNPKTCVAGERCQNQMFEARISPRLEVVGMKERGFGLICRESISAGTFIIEYVGEVINQHEFNQRIAQRYNEREENYYFLLVEKDYIIDAGPKGNFARFMNHSCDPNCETQKWMVNGINRIGIFAIKDIEADTELTFNYHWDEILGDTKKACYCGTPNCIGYIGGKGKIEKDNTTEQSVPKIKKTKIPRKKRQKKRTTTSATATATATAAINTVKMSEARHDDATDNA